MLNLINQTYSEGNMKKNTLDRYETKDFDYFFNSAINDYNIFWEVVLDWRLNINVIIKKYKRIIYICILRSEVKGGSYKNQVLRIDLVLKKYFQGEESYTKH
jgi:hypothetical protein